MGCVCCTFAVLSSLNIARYSIATGRCSSPTIPFSLLSEMKDKLEDCMHLVRNDERMENGSQQDQNPDP